MVSASWTKVAQSDSLQRSSHTVSSVGGRIVVTGGELQPREPRDNKIFAIDANGGASSKLGTVEELKQSSQLPCPRVGSASATIDNVLYLYSGRGGVEMQPIDEKGALWAYDLSQNQWALLRPADPLAPFPAARSYHCMTSDRHKNLYVHAGCPIQGRMADLWVFNIVLKTWTQLSDAPGPARGGTSIAYCDGQLYRMNGFDGKTEQGGQIDGYDVASGKWTSREYTADGIGGPVPRSVSALLPVRVGGRSKLLTLFGECDPSSLGHAGAGKMLGDVWIYDIQEGIWQEVEHKGDTLPAARGWFDGDVLDTNRVAVVGGLSETNERLDDAWVLSF